MAAGVERSGPTGIMTAWRRSLVTITTTGLAVTSARGVDLRGAVGGGGACGSDGRSVMAAAWESAVIWGEQMHAPRHLDVVTRALCRW